MGGPNDSTRICNISTNTWSNQNNVFPRIGSLRTPYESGYFGSNVNVSYRTLLSTSNTPGMNGSRSHRDMLIETINEVERLLLMNDGDISLGGACNVQQGSNIYTKWVISHGDHSIAYVWMGIKHHLSDFETFGYELRSWWSMRSLLTEKVTIQIFFSCMGFLH